MHFTVKRTGEAEEACASVQTQFKSANRIEWMATHTEEGARTYEYRITYCTNHKHPCPNDCQCVPFELDPRALEALSNAWPDQLDDILKSLFLNHDHYGFGRWGMYVGVEFDGYIHT